MIDINHLLSSFILQKTKKAVNNKILTTGMLGGFSSNLGQYQEKSQCLSA